MSFRDVFVDLKDFIIDKANKKDFKYFTYIII